MVLRYELTCRIAKVALAVADDFQRKSAYLTAHDPRVDREVAALHIHEVAKVDALHVAHAQLIAFRRHCAVRVCCQFEPQVVGLLRADPDIRCRIAILERVVGRPVCAHPRCAGRSFGFLEDRAEYDIRRGAGHLAEVKLLGHGRCAGRILRDVELTARTTRLS